MSSSLKRWFNDLQWMQQGVLISCIRNCDGILSEGPAKVLVRGIRSACIKSAMTKGSFNARRPNPENLMNACVSFVDDHIDHCPIHFVAHLMHASEVIGYTHPDKNIAAIWENIYKTIVNELHLNVETREHFSDRLKDDPAQVTRENAYDEMCYQLKNYGDNNGVVNE